MPGGIVRVMVLVPAARVMLLVRKGPDVEPGLGGGRGARELGECVGAVDAQQQWPRAAVHVLRRIADVQVIGARAADGDGEGELVAGVVAEIDIAGAGVIGPQPARHAGVGVGGGAGQRDGALAGRKRDGRGFGLYRDRAERGRRPLLDGDVEIDRGRGERAVARQRLQRIAARRDARAHGQDPAGQAEARGQGAAAGQLHDVADGIAVRIRRAEFGRDVDRRRRAGGGGEIVDIGARRQNRRLVLRPVGDGDIDELGHHGGPVADLIDIVAVGIGRGLEIGRGDEAQGTGRRVDGEFGAVRALSAQRIAERRGVVAVGRGDGLGEERVLGHGNGIRAGDLRRIERRADAHGGHGQGIEVRPGERGGADRELHRVAAGRQRHRHRLHRPVRPAVRVGPGRGEGQGGLRSAVHGKVQRPVPGATVRVAEMERIGACRGHSDREGHGIAERGGAGAVIDIAAAGASGAQAAAVQDLSGSGDLRIARGADDGVVRRIADNQRVFCLKDHIKFPSTVRSKQGATPVASRCAEPSLTLRSVFWGLVPCDTAAASAAMPHPGALLRYSRTCPGLAFCRNSALFRLVPVAPSLHELTG